MGFFPNLFQSSQIFFKGKKWARRQENNRYDKHRNRLLNIRPVVNTDPPKAYQILTKRLLLKRRTITMDSRGTRPPVVTVPDTESLKDWKACRQQQQSATQLKRLISAEELNHVLAELERSATRVLEEPAEPKPVGKPELSSSQLVEQVEELERSFTDLSPAARAAEDPYKKWVVVRQSETGRRGDAAARLPAVARPPPAAQLPDRPAGAVGGGSVPELCLTRPTEAAGDFWITAREAKNASPRRIMPYITINNEKIPIVINKYPAPVQQKTVPNSQGHQQASVSEQADPAEANKGCQTESESSTHKQQSDQKKVRRKKRSDFPGKQLVGEKQDSVCKATDSSTQAAEKPGQQVVQQRMLAVNPDDHLSSEALAVLKRAPKKSEKDPEPKQCQVKTDSDKKSSLKLGKATEANQSTKGEGEVNREDKPKKQRTKSPRTDTSRENHSDTEVETTERKKKVQKPVDPKEKRAFSDNIQVIKVFLKKKLKNQPNDFVELAERSTQTVQYSRSETVANSAIRKSISQNIRNKDGTDPSKGTYGRSKSEHAIQRNEARPMNQRVVRLTSLQRGPMPSSDPTLVRGVLRQPQPAPPRPAPTKSETKVLPTRNRGRSPSPAVRVMNDAARRNASPARNQPASPASPARNPSPPRNQPSPPRNLSASKASTPRQRSAQQGRQSARKAASGTPRGQRSPRSTQDSRKVTISTPVVLPPQRPGSRGKGRQRPTPPPPPDPPRRRLARLKPRVKEPPGALSRGNAANIITTPGGSSLPKPPAQDNCVMCASEQPPLNRTERVRRVIHRVTAVIDESPDSSPPASPTQPAAGAARSGRRHRQLLTRIDALAAPRRRYTEQAENQVRAVRPAWRQAPGELYQRAMRGAACRSCNIVRTPSPLSSNPFAYMDIEADGRPLGRLTILLRADLAPRTVENFRSLCTGEYGFGYKGTLFHRVIPRFVCQGGDVTFGGGNKQAPLSIYDRLFEDESFEMNHSEPGVVSMVNNGPNTNGTQFFICAAKITWLDGKNVAFGLVTDGLQVLRKIEALGTSQGVPLKRIVVHRCGQIIND